MVYSLISGGKLGRYLRRLKGSHIFFLYYTFFFSNSIRFYLNITVLLSSNELLDLRTFSQDEINPVAVSILRVHQFQVILPSFVRHVWIRRQGRHWNCASSDRMFAIRKQWCHIPLSCPTPPLVCDSGRLWMR